MTEIIKLPKLKRYIAGVDPGVHTGVAVYDREEGRIVFLKQTDFFGVAAFLRSVVRCADLKVYVEQPKAFIYSRNQKRFSDKDDRIRDNYLVKVGGNRREAQLLRKQLELEQFDVDGVDPVGKTKWTEHEFKLMTKWNFSSTEHERDAARLAIYYANNRSLNGKNKG